MHTILSYNETLTSRIGPAWFEQYRLKSSRQAKERYGVSVSLSVPYRLHNTLFLRWAKMPFSDMWAMKSRYGHLAFNQASPAGPLIEPF